MLVNQKEFARIHGVHRATVGRWAAAGLLVMEGRHIQVEKSNARLAERPEEYRGGRTSGPHEPDVAVASEGPSLAEAKRVRATFEALLAEHRSDKLSNSIVAVDVAVQAVADDSAAIKARFRSVPAWVAPKLVAADTAPVAGAIVWKTFRGALHDISKKDDEPAWDGDVEERLISEGEGTLSHVDVDGVCHYVRRPNDEPKPVEEPKKKRRRRSTQAIEAAIKEAGADKEVDHELLTKVERAVPVMSLNQARLRKEVAEGRLKESQYALLKHKVVLIDQVHAALTKNFNGVRANALGIASKVAPRVALLTDAKDIEQVISTELELVLDDMAAPETLIDGVMTSE